MEEKKDLMVQENHEKGINFFGNVADFKEGWNIAATLSQSDLVPATFKGKPANVIIAMNMSQRMDADLLMVMQNLVVVHGTPTFEAKFAIACFNATGKYTAIKYKDLGEFGKDTYGKQAYCIEKSTGELCEGPIITIGMAKAEGWYNQNPKWRNAPDLMLRYRAASWFIRTTDPGVMMGFQTREEVEDTIKPEEILPEEINTEAAFEAEQNANTEEIIVPEPETAEPQGNTPAEPAPAKEPEPKPATAETPKKAKPMGAAPTPELFK